MKTIRLNNGVEVPILGFGTFQITDPQEAENSVVHAIKAGYRHIDTAQSYLNEEAVGRGIKKSGASREELFITTKIWISNTTYDGVLESFQRSLDRLNLEYIDLLLLHQPYNDTYGAWRAMEKLQEEGKVRAIGISNFSVAKAVDLSQFNKTTPAVNQIEINPYHQQSEMIEELRAEGIVSEAWAPFAEGKNNLFQNPVLATIGAKYNKTVAQVIIRWLIEQDVIVLAKTVKPERMEENLSIFDFALTEEDKEAIKTLDKSESQFFSHDDPEMIKALAGRILDV